MEIRIWPIKVRDMVQDRDMVTMMKD